MGEIKFKVSDKVEKEFREKAMKVFGHRRGSLKKAGEKALREWSQKIEEIDSTIGLPDDPVEATSGILSDVDKSGVKLQHELGKIHKEKYEKPENKTENKGEK